MRDETRSKNIIRDVKVPHSKTKDCELTEEAKISFFGILNADMQN